MKVDLDPQEGTRTAAPRRRFLSWMTMGASLLLSYGTAFVFGMRFLQPRKQERRFREVFVTTTDRVPAEGGLTWRDPQGRTVVIRKVGERIIALSNRCPHLGCQVHWREAENRFLCPCHDGAFDAEGRPTAGPPLAEGKALPAFETSLRGNAVYLKIEEL